MITKKIIFHIKNIIYKNKYVQQNESGAGIRGKVILQLVAAASFLMLSVTNILEKSYVMLIYTAIGFAVNLVFAIISAVIKSGKLSSYSSILSCTLVFALFVIVGGNDGFASLWVILLPVFAMAIMDFFFGFIASVCLGAFLFAIFRTPLSGLLQYSYNQQFCVRFPILFAVSFLMGVCTTIILLNSKYRALISLSELQKVTEKANRLAKYDSLTGLANRRCVYEIIDKDFADETVPHTIVMGDIDHFKMINDTYGHEFGDEVLVIISNYIMENLPESYVKSRWGGEEFLIAANEPIDRVFEQMQALREKIAVHEYCRNGETINVTMTFGIAEYYKADDLNDTINLADSRLYRGKKTSRNSIIMR